eukprot:1136982-Pelagomonas_calceolata.AAC.6
MDCQLQHYAGLVSAAMSTSPCIAQKHAGIAFKGSCGPCCKPSSDLQTLSELLGMSTLLLPVTFMMPNMMCMMSSILFPNAHTPGLFSGPLLPLSSASSLAVLYLSPTLHVQSFDTFAFMKQNNCKMYPYLHEFLSLYEQP